MVLERRDIDAKYKWDLSKIYKTREDFELDLSSAEKIIREFKRYEKTLTRSAEDLLEALTAYVKIDGYIEKLWAYANLGFCTDTSDNSLQSLAARVRNLAASAGEATWFVTPYILKLDTETVSAWMTELPALRSFERMILKILAYKPYTLSDDCERLISSLEDCLGSHDEIRGIFANSDMRFGMIRDEEGKRVELTDANYSLYLRSSDRKVRASAFREMYKTYGSFKNTFATVLYSRIKESTTLARVRGYNSSIEASTFADEVTPEIYDNLIRTVESGLEPLYDYYDYKKNSLGVDRLHLYDVYTPLAGELTREYSYEEAIDEVLGALRVLGDEYCEALREGLCERGWVDVYPTRAKRGGAFSAGGAYTDPYILLNFNGTYDDVSTLAHEAGHSMHTVYSTKNNAPHNSHYRIFVAEVASTVNELLLAKSKLRDAKSDEEKFYIISQLVETYRATLYRQTMFASFEREMHARVEKGEPLTAELISSSYKKLVRKYFGKNVTIDSGIALEWARIPHFYSCFYVYKYATCISAATAIVKKITEGGEEYVKRYLDFLSVGDSLSPLESLLVCGIDMRDPEVVRSAIDEFADLVSQLKSLENK